MSTGRAQKKLKCTRAAASVCRRRRQTGRASDALGEVGVHAPESPVEPAVPPHACHIAEVVAAAVGADFGRQRIKEIVDKQCASYKTKYPGINQLSALRKGAAVFNESATSRARRQLPRYPSHNKHAPACDLGKTQQVYHQACQQSTGAVMRCDYRALHSDTGRTRSPRSSNAPRATETPTVSPAPKRMEKTSFIEANKTGGPEVEG